MVPLREYNDSRAGDPGVERVALLVKGEDGTIRGGLWGIIAFDWMFVEYLVVPEEARGQGLGSELMGQAEEIAREHGCLGMFLDTFDFQAPEFYRKMGFEVYGRLEDHPAGQARNYMSKRF
ncbi:GNAT family N-acetyltransferase [Altererythrobacter salegens]|uniref:GNAT family N-acetyltransferase n=2 Tax=Croceibacterium salegens TaxID=1737568 RepID=A0A6I4SX74_9SPHN|nr:GNAT family N-acetyltransferase [Croceibacterium salegens]